MARPKILVLQHVPHEPLGTLDPCSRNSEVFQWHEDEISGPVSRDATRAVVPASTQPALATRVHVRPNSVSNRTMGTRS